MKKILIALVIAASFVGIAKAEYLLWQVTSDQFGDITENQASTLVAYYDGTYTPLATALGTGENRYKMTGNSIDYVNSTYFVELGTYDSSYSASNAMLAQNDNPLTGFRYQDIHLTLTTSPTAIKATWAGAVRTANATPEPTSGLMMLVGMALLGLKRRRV